MTTPTQPGTLDHRQMWQTIIDEHGSRYFDNHNKRVPMSIMANRKTLNVLVTGIHASNYLTFEKSVIHTSRGKLYLITNTEFEDGEITYL